MSDETENVTQSVVVATDFVEGKGYVATYAAVSWTSKKPASREFSYNIWAPKGAVIRLDPQDTAGFVSAGGTVLSINNAESIDPNAGGLSAYVKGTGGWLGFTCSWQNGSGPGFGGGSIAAARTRPKPKDPDTVKLADEKVFGYYADVESTPAYGPSKSSYSFTTSFKLYLKRRTRSYKRYAIDDPDSPDGWKWSPDSLTDALNSGQINYGDWEEYLEKQDSKRLTYFPGETRHYVDRYSNKRSEQLWIYCAPLSSGGSSGGSSGSSSGGNITITGNGGTKPGEGEKVDPDPVVPGLTWPVIPGGNEPPVEADPYPGPTPVGGATVGPVDPTDPTDPIEITVTITVPFNEDTYYFTIPDGFTPSDIQLSNAVIDDVQWLWSWIGTKEPRRLCFKVTENTDQAVRTAVILATASNEYCKISVRQLYEIKEKILVKFIDHELTVTRKEQNSVVYLASPETVDWSKYTLSITGDFEVSNIYKGTDGQIRFTIPQNDSLVMKSIYITVVDNEDGTNFDTLKIIQQSLGQIILERNDATIERKSGILSINILNPLPFVSEEWIITIERYGLYGTSEKWVWAYFEEGILKIAVTANNAFVSRRAKITVSHVDNSSNSASVLLIQNGDVETSVKHLMVLDKDSERVLINASPYLFTGENSQNI